jgi:hypothetical protein
MLRKIKVQLLMAVLLSMMLTSSFADMLMEYTISEYLGQVVILKLELVLKYGQLLVLIVLLELAATNYHLLVVQHNVEMLIWIA